MRKTIIVVAILAILALSFFMMSTFMGMKQEPPERTVEETLKKVKAVETIYKEITATTVATGRLGSNRNVDLMAEVSGEILQGNIPLKKGQKFKKGDLLVRIFDDEAEYNLKASKSRFLTSIANALPDFRIDYPERYDALLAFFNSINIDEPLPELPEIKSSQIKTFLSSRNILNQYFTIKSAEIRYQKYNIYAPFNGSYTDVMLEVGSIANMGSRLARIIRTDKLELEVPVEIDNIRWLKLGDAVTVTADGGNTQWSGKIVRISDFVDANSQSASVFISLPHKTSQPLYEGQYLRAYFEGTTVSDAMEIDRSAVYNFNEVFTVIDGKLEKKIIDVLKINQETLLFSGLDEGTLVVVEPLVNATNGMLVDIAD